jgi:hypothetical protein
MQKTVAKIGFWSAIVAFIGAVGYVLSVPLQTFNLVSPLQDSVIAFGFSIIIATPFLLSMVALHYTVPEEKKFWTNAIGHKLSRLITCQEGILEGFG